MKIRLIIAAICLLIVGAIYPPIMGISSSIPKEQKQYNLLSDSLRLVLDSTENKISVGAENLKVQHTIIKIQKRFHEFTKSKREHD